MPDSIKQQKSPIYPHAQISNSKYHFSMNLVLNVIWLFLAAAAVYLFGIEKNKGFDTVVFLITGGFIVYTFIPFSYRKLALIGIAFVIEIYLLGILSAVGVLIFISLFVCLTYISNVSLRNISALALTVGCAFFLWKGFSFFYLRIIILFGSVFLMMRYIYLLYELNYFKSKPDFISRLAYLFLFPNACFPLFPILDPKVFSSRFYAVPSQDSLKQGLVWITRGILHTLIYRCIYLYLTPSPYEIEGFWKLLLFVFSGYSLILRLSGLFYISLGFLCIFGFDLPAIFDNYFFASGFTDMWRRINLYWRSFITRVFYYPLLFKLKKWPLKKTVVIATLFIFLCTWFLHSWQWFWIKGKYSFSLNDVLFWSFLGIVISMDSYFLLNEFDKSKNKKEGRFGFIKKGSKVIFMLITISFLWTFWTCNSITEWCYLLTFMKTAFTKDVLIFVGALIFLIAAASAIRYLYDRKKWFDFVFNDFSLSWGITFNALLIISFFALKNSCYRNEILNFASNNLNNKDRSAMERGYYELILNNDEQSIELFNTGNETKKWNLDNKGYVPVNNILIKEFKPNFKTVFKGDSLSTDQLGLRDREYSLIKEKNVTRIALLGGSYEMGSGVSNNENFAAIIEDEINKVSNGKVEILNYAEGGYHLLQNVYVTNYKIKKTNPDYLFYFAHSNEIERDLDDFINVIEKKRPLSFKFLDSIFTLTGIKDGMCRLEKYNKAKPFSKELIKWGYNSITNYCKQNNIIPILVFLPVNANLREDNEKWFCLETARAAGFEIIELKNVYDGYVPETIQLSLWDTHPNRKGHKIIADKLFKEIMNKKEKFKFLKLLFGGI